MALRVDIDVENNKSLRPYFNLYFSCQVFISPFFRVMTLSEVTIYTKANAMSTEMALNSTIIPSDATTAENNSLQIVEVVAFFAVVTIQICIVIGICCYCRQKAFSKIVQDMVKYITQQHSQGQLIILPQTSDPNINDLNITNHNSASNINNQNLDTTASTANTGNIVDIDNINTIHDIDDIFGDNIDGNDIDDILGDLNATISSYASTLPVRRISDTEDME